MPQRAHRARLAGAPCSLVALLLRAGAATLALAAGVVSAAPAASAARASADGVLEVQVEDFPQAARTRHWLKAADGRRVELRLPGKPPAAPRSGARLRVNGTLSGDVMALSGTDSSSISVVDSAQASVTTGEQSVGVLLVNFTDDRSQPFTVAQAQDMVFNQVSAFYREASFQKTWLNGATYGWLQLPIARTCTTSDIASGSNLVGSLLVRTGTDGDINSSYLLDMTPGTIPTWDLGDAALVAGKTFSDTTAGVAVTLNSADANGASVAVTLAGSACVRSAPMVGLTGGAASVAPGGSVTYTVTVTSRDSSSCAATGFSLQGLPPAGWSGSVGSASLTLAPGASGSASFTVGAPATAVAGSYPVSAKAVNGANTVLAGSGGVTLTLAVPTLAATAGTNKAAYTRNDTVLMSSSVSANGAPVAGASVSFTLVRADGSTVTQSATTNSAGLASGSYRIGRKDAAGAWQLRALTTRSGATASASSAFNVQ